MKLIIAGSRDLNPTFGFIKSCIQMFSPGTITEIVSGCAEGVDSEGEHFASHMNIPVKRFPADWDKHGKAAGPIRNREMAQYADVLLVIHNGSNGSINMKLEMMKLGKRVYEIQLWSNEGQTFEL